MSHSTRARRIEQRRLDKVVVGPCTKPPKGAPSQVRYVRVRFGHSVGKNNKRYPAQSPRECTRRRKQMGSGEFRYGIVDG